MIRVVIRHVLETDGRLLGDFSPSEIPALLDLVRGSEMVIYPEGLSVSVVDRGDMVDGDDHRFVLEGDMRKRAIMEIIIDTDADQD